MHTYLFLRDPAHSRVYFAEAARMAAAELEACTQKMNLGLSNIREMQLASMPALAAEAEQPLSEAALGQLMRLSFVYGIFETAENDLLRPLNACPGYALGEEMSAMLKYSGKTNERFTRLMINLALFASDFIPGQLLHVLDPMCGKGTTLMEAMILGHQATGCELLRPSAHEAEVFIQKYFEHARIIHKKTPSRVSLPEGKNVADIVDILYAHDRATFKEEPRKATIIKADTRHLGRIMKKKSVHLLVTDLPYSVQHDAHELEHMLKRAAPVWLSLLRPGAGIAISFNTLTLRRAVLEGILQSAGFTIVGQPLEHRVEQAIVRDVVVARV